MESVVYGLWLHRMTGSAAEPNRFGREYSIVRSQDPSLGRRMLAVDGLP